MSSPGSPAMTPNTSETGCSSPDETDEARLKRIQFLVDKSKLYAGFLRRSLETEKNPQPKPKVPQQTRGKQKSNPAKKQKTLTSFYKQQTPDNVPDGIKAPLHPYQVQGMQWMVNLYQNGLNGILADEMGLGKTIQVIAFIAYLIQNDVSGPFLVVAPLSTIANWKSEFKRFAPDINVCKYYGNPQTRAAIRKNDLKHLKTTVVITSYELVMVDAAHLNKLLWKYIIVDEGHRLKNLNCKLTCELKKYHSASRLLLTGTPLQNNLTELWALLNFLLPDVFTDLQVFQSWFESGDVHIDEEHESHLISSLHEILRPFLLRRMKTDVNLNLPEKREYVIFTGLTPQQTDLYHSVLHGNAREYVTERILIERGVDPTAVAPPTRRQRRTVNYAEPDSDIESQESDAGDKLTKQMVNAASSELRHKSFRNVIMQLRQVCNSPFMLYYPWYDKPVDERLESTSGKLKVLDALFSRLIPGHKVLLFSQFTKMLDLLEDWLVLKGYNFCRIDGSTNQETRQTLLENFSTDSDTDVFLLSTRSGGQGINLTAADTVVIFDSDWNPHQDLQAMDRVHRIGQDKPVLVFRLITGDSVEENLLDTADAKLELGNIVIDKGRFKGVGESAEEQIKSMDKQLQKHKVQFDGGVTVSDEDFEKMLDRSPEAYAEAVEYPKLTENIYCR